MAREIGPAVEDLPEALANAWHIIAETRRFDAAFYLERNPDVAAAGVDPLRHYVEHGAAEGRDPSRRFSSSFYLSQNPDVAATGMNPFVHFIQHGEKEGRAPMAGSSPAADLHAPSIGAFPPLATDPFELKGIAAITAQIQRSCIGLDRSPRSDDGAWSPLISIIMPVYNTPPRFLREVIQSVRAQTYDNWELCIVDDHSTAPETAAILKELADHPKVRLQRLDRNAGIAVASHAALMMATGDFIGFVDHDDLLLPAALAEVVAALREDPALDYIYSDHAMATVDGLPHFAARKPAWSPEFLLSTNYIVHFKIVRRELLVAVGGIEHERRNVQDLGMSLRLMAASAKVRHLDKILYLWRDHAGSVASGSQAKEGIERHLIASYNDLADRRRVPGRHYWPRRFRQTRTGVFAIHFDTGSLPPAATVVLVEDPAAMTLDELPTALHDRSDRIHLVARGRAGRSRSPIRWLDDERAERAFFASLDTEHVVICRTSVRNIGAVGWETLGGLLMLDPAIGMVGAKTLDTRLSVVGGGLMLDRQGRYRLIAGSESDAAPGHWFTAQAVSNVDALHTGGFAVRRQSLVDGPGLRWHRFGAFADVALAQALVEAGSRLVFEPRVRLVDTAPPARIEQAVLAEIDQKARHLMARRLLREW